MVCVLALNDTSKTSPVKSGTGSPGNESLSVAGTRGAQCLADAHDQLELTPLGDDAWRACEVGVPENDPSRVVAYIERRGDGFEVVWLRGPHRGVRFYTLLADAIDEACAVLVAEATSSATRPIPIAHLAPTA